MQVGDIRCIVATLCERNAPSLFVDTSILLDIIQAPLRTKKPEQAIRRIRAARAVTEAVTRGTLSLVITQTIDEEFKRRVDGVTGELRNEIEKAERIDACIRELASAAVLPGERAARRHAELFREQAEGLRKVAFIAEDDDDCIIRGFRRNESRRRPGRQGKQSADCVTIEHCLEVSQRSMVAGHLGARVFVTSNKNDYHGAGTNALDTDLATEFRAADLEFALDLESALGRCNLSGLLERGVTPGRRGLAEPGDRG